MMKVCLMASHGYPLGPELGFCRFSKDCQNLWPNNAPKYEFPRVDSFNLRPHQSEEPWKPISGFPEAIQFVEIESTIRKKLVLVNMQDTNPNSTVFTFGIAEECTRQDKILEFLTSGSNKDKAEFDLSTFSELIGLQASNISNSHQNCNSFDYGTSVTNESLMIFPGSDQGPIFDIVGDMVRRSKITFNSDGKVMFSGTGAELKDILSVVAEYYLANNSNKWRKQTLLIPHFNSEAMTIIQEPTTLLENVKYAPLISPEKIKLKPTPKKKTNKKARERDLYERNYFHACESLLSIIVNKKRNKKTAILSLKKSGPELPHLLTQFSATIAGTGLAVIFSVICKMGYNKVPFCTSKLFNTGIGLGLVWLSWGVNKLRDTVVCISKNSSKMSVKEEEAIKKLDTCVHDVLFRAAAVMMVTVLRIG